MPGARIPARADDERCRREYARAAPAARARCAAGVRCGLRFGLRPQARSGARSGVREVSQRLPGRHRRRRRFRARSGCRAGSRRHRSRCLERPGPARAPRAACRRAAGLDCRARWLALQCWLERLSFGLDRNAQATKIRSKTLRINRNPRRDPMLGLMQDWPLLCHRIIDHAAIQHGSREVVTRSIEGPTHRTTYREIRKRALQVAQRLQKDGVKLGDRVATLAWNTWRHLETWYGITGIGAVYHTINPRLFPEQIVYIAGHAEDRLMFLDTTFVPLMEDRKSTRLNS